MKTYLFLLLFVFQAFSLSSQISLKGYNQEKIDPSLFEGRWKARWISYPGEAPNVYGVYHFRKSFDLEVVPSRFIVHVSADNRYKLYVNGKLVSLGPARGDIYNWSFETVDLAPYLRKGKNTLASVVWNYAERKPVAQISYDQTGFILQGNTGHEAVVNTDTTWVCLRNKAYAPWTEWQVLGYYVAGPGEELEASAYPWAGNNRITTTGNGRRPYGAWRVPRKDREITRDGCWFLARYLRWTAGSSVWPSSAGRKGSNARKDFLTGQKL